MYTHTYTHTEDKHKTLKIQKKNLEDTIFSTAQAHIQILLELCISKCKIMDLLLS